MTDRNYGGIIWTNHAMQRLNERGIKQGDAWATWNRPDQSRYSKTQGAWIYYKVWGDIKIEVVAKKNDQDQWVVISVWSKKIYNDTGVKKSSWLDLLRKIFFND